MRKYKVFLCGYSGFPHHKSASCEKQRLIAKAINRNPNFEVLISNYISFTDDRQDFKGNYDGINYRLFSLYSFKLKNSILFRLNKLYGKINELCFLLSNKFEFIIVSDRNVFYLLGLILVSKITSKKMILTFVEDYSKSNNSKNLRSVFFDFLYYRIVIRKIDGAFPISEYLSTMLEDKKPGLPKLKVPVFTDYDYFDNIIPSRISNYYLYCGAAGYLTAIRYIIDEFDEISGDVELKLVINGSKSEMKTIETLLDSKKKKNKIKLLRGLQYEDLVRLYKESLALIIPLENSIYDKARFPHKIAEYCASKRPIISTDFGEVSNYFENKDNAFLITDNTPNSLTKMMDFLLEDQELRERVAQRSYKTGSIYFNYKSYTDSIIGFMLTL